MEIDGATARAAASKPSRPTVLLGWKLRTSIKAGAEFPATGRISSCIRWRHHRQIRLALPAPSSGGPGSRRSKAPRESWPALRAAVTHEAGRITGR